MRKTEDYSSARRWADKFLQRQRQALATLLNVPLAAVVVTDDEAYKAGVDVTINGITIGLRVRRADALHRYWLQPTIRTSKGRDGLSELDKIKHGRLNYMLLSYATTNASGDNTDDTLQATVLLDLQPMRRAALDGFSGVTTSPLEADRVHALAIGLASLMAAHGPCVVYQQVTTRTTSTDTTTAINPITGLHHLTSETETIDRTTDAHNPTLLATSRQRAALAA